MCPQTSHESSNMKGHEERCTDITWWGNGPRLPNFDARCSHQRRAVKSGQDELKETPSETLYNQLTRGKRQQQKRSDQSLEIFTNTVLTKSEILDIKGARLTYSSVKRRKISPDNFKSSKMVLQKWDRNWVISK